MSIIIENHPFSALSQQIERMIWASVILISFVAALSLVNMGHLSLFIGPILILLTMAHNLTLIGLISRDRTKSTAQLKGTLAPTSTKVTIITTWILVALWSLMAIVTIIISALVIAGHQLDTFGKLAVCIEGPLVVAEICVLAVLANKCGKQRRSTIVLPESVDWQHFGPPVSARV